MVALPTSYNNAGLGSNFFDMLNAQTFNNSYPFGAGSSTGNIFGSTFGNINPFAESGMDFNPLTSLYGQQQPSYLPQYMPYPQPTQQQQPPQDNSMMMMILMMLLMKKKQQTVEPAPYCPPPVTPNYGGPTGQTWGDPHFVCFEGGKYDVQGKAGKTYNIISDKTLQMNARFDEYTKEKGATVMGAVGIKVGDEKSGVTKIEADAKTGVAKVNGKELKKGDTVKFKTGVKDQNGADIEGSAVWDGKKLTVNTAEYQIELTDKGGHFDTHYRVSNFGVRADGVQSHGLLGQTADFDGKARNGKQGAGAQGEGAIDGVYTDYEVSDLFGDNFKFNRYGAAAGQVEFGVGAGKGADAEGDTGKKTKKKD